MIELILVVLFFGLLIGIFVRSGKGQPRGLGAAPCPYCRQLMYRNATVCASCGRESKMMSIRDRMWAEPIN